MLVIVTTMIPYRLNREDGGQHDDDVDDGRVNAYSIAYVGL